MDVNANTICLEFVFSNLSVIWNLHKHTRDALRPLHAILMFRDFEFRIWNLFVIWDL